MLACAARETIDQNMESTANEKPARVERQGLLIHAISNQIAPAFRPRETMDASCANCSRALELQTCPFKPDPFQLEALSALEFEDVLVTAPTGSGKTWIAREEIGVCWVVATSLVHHSAQSAHQFKVCGVQRRVWRDTSRNPDRGS